MGKLQLTILAFLLVSCFIHIRRQLLDGTYLKRLFLGQADQKDRILYLDYIRLSATLFVVLVHCIDFSFTGMPAGSKAWIAVQSLSSVLLICNPLFVMNSGALILNGHTKNLWDFYYKRFLKVVIPFFCYYGIYILLSCQYFNSGFVHGICLAIKDMLAGPIDWAPHLWVIYIIISLYFLAPFFSLLLKHLKSSMLHGLAILILLSLCAGVYLPVLGFPINFQLMISPWLGIFLLGYYFAHPAAMLHRKLYWSLGGAACLFSILLTAFFPDYQTLLSTQGSPAMIFMAGSAFLILRALENRLKKPGFLMKFMIRHSYSILLIHWAVLYFVRERFEIPLHTFGRTGSALLSFILVLLLSAIASFLYDQTVVLCVQSLFKALIRPMKRQ